MAAPRIALANGAGTNGLAVPVIGIALATLRTDHAAVICAAMNKG
jgi:hypothetical protein